MSPGELIGIATAILGAGGLIWQIRHLADRVKEMDRDLRLMGVQIAKLEARAEITARFDIKTGRRIP